MRILYLDCTTGVSGDMLLASLGHLLEDFAGPGHGFDFLRCELERLGIEGLEVRDFVRKVAGITTRGVEVVQTADQPLRTIADLTAIIERAGLVGMTRARALDALILLAKAESKVHGIPIDQVHFHEIGAVDTIADIVGVSVLLDRINSDFIIVSPIDLGSGFVTMAHGTLPVPAPAVAELAKGLVTVGSDAGMERATPTGMALTRVLAHECGPMPKGVIEAVGYGSGGRSSDQQPTYVRSFLITVNDHAGKAVFGHDR